MREPRRKDQKLTGDRIEVDMGLLQVGITKIHVRTTQSVEVWTIEARDAILCAKSQVFRAFICWINLNTIDARPGAIPMRVDVVVRPGVGNLKPNTLKPDPHTWRRGGPCTLVGKDNGLAQAVNQKLNQLFVMILNL